MADISKIKLPNGTTTYDLKDGSAVTSFSVSGKTVTYTKRDGTTGTFTTQDTTYDAITTTWIDENLT